MFDLLEFTKEGEEKVNGDVHLCEELLVSRKAWIWIRFGFGPLFLKLVACKCIFRHPTPFAFHTYLPAKTGSRLRGPRR